MVSTRVTFTEWWWTTTRWRGYPWPHFTDRRWTHLWSRRQSLSMILTRQRTAEPPTSGPWRLMVMRLMCNLVLTNFAFRSFELNRTLIISMFMCHQPLPMSVVKVVCADIIIKQLFLKFYPFKNMFLCCNIFNVLFS